MVYDIVIVGAGPGGLISAIHCAKAGLNIALVDKSHFPVHKVCGDGFTTPVLNELKALNYKLYEAFIAASGSTINKIQYSFYKGPIFSVNISNPIITCDRAKFHQLLTSELNKYQVDLYSGIKVKKVSEEYNEISCNLEDGTTLRSKIIIGADGPSSIVRECLLPNQSCKKSIALRAYFDNVKYPANTIGLFSNINLPTSGIWLFPLGNGKANIGFGLHQDILAKKNLNLKTEFEKQLKQFPLLANALKNAKQTSNYKGGPIAIYNKNMPISGKRFFLAGDAASLADPFNGEGIGYAMASGRYAATQAIYCIQQKTFNSKINKQYDKQVYNRVGKWNKKHLLMANLWRNFPLLYSLPIKASNNPVVKKIVKNFFR